MLSKSRISGPFHVDESSKELGPDGAKIREQVGEAIILWTRLETELFFVYAHIAHPEGFPLGVSAAFHEVRGFHERLRMVDALISNNLAERKYNQVRSKWTKLSAKLLATSKKRNMLAHGLVFTVEHITYWAPYYDLASIVIEMTSPHLQNEIKRNKFLTLEKVQGIVNQMIEAGQELANFRRKDVPHLELPSRRIRVGYDNDPSSRG